MSKYYYLPLLLVALLCSNDMFGQRSANTRVSQEANSFQRCHADEIHADRYATDVAYARDYDQRMVQLEEIKRVSAMEGARINCTDPIIIPVAVHYEGVTNQTDQCLLDLALSQIQVLNEDYSSTNSDVSNFCDDVENSNLDGTALAWGRSMYCILLS